MSRPPGPGVPIVFGAAILVVVASVLLGGASHDNPLLVAAVELASLPLLAVCLRTPASREDRRTWPALATASLCLALALPWLQLVPLPPSLWTALPGSGPVVASLEAARLALPWRPLSLAPSETLDAALALAPPAAMFLAAMRLSEGQRRTMVGAWSVLGLASLALGAGQLAASQNAGPYLYAITNYGSLVGFFANRNHQASFLLALLPVAAVVATGAGRRGAGNAGRAVVGVFFVLAIVGLGVVRSRAGIILAAPALAASAVIVWRARGRRPRTSAGRALAAASAAAAVAVLLFGLTPIAQRFDRAAPAEFRFEAWPSVASLAKAHLPLGAGIGSFDRVYRAAEPLRRVGPQYFNHAHNDWLELWLEAGWPAAVAMLVFLAWFARACLAVWIEPDAPPDLARAASVSIAIVLIHSLVDYPLRTETMAVFFAFCCGVLAAPGGLAGAGVAAGAATVDRSRA